MLRIILGFFLLTTTCLAQNVDRMDQAVQSYVSNNQFMGSALVARGDRIIFSKSYGSANLEWDVPNTPRTKFRIGSITKQFTAACVLLLEEQGKLKIEDPINKYLTDAPAAWDKITIFHVLTHTAGIPSYTNDPGYQKLRPFEHTPEQLVALFRDKPLEFEPGEETAYSNSGYILLGYLLEKVSGETYQDFLQNNIFDPLGMKDSGYDSNSAIIPRRAAGYTLGLDGPKNADFEHMSVPFSAGALYSTTEDLWRWEQGLFGGKLLSAASLKKMTEPFKNVYASGLNVNTHNGRKRISHGGAISGFSSFLAYYPEDKLTVAVLGNLNGSAPKKIAGILGSLAHGDEVALPLELKEYGVLFERLELPDEKIQDFKTLLVDITRQWEDEIIPFLGDPSLSEEERKYFEQQVKAKFEKQVKDLLGPENYEIYNAYAERLNERMILTNDMDPIGADLGLSDEKEQELIDAMYEARKEAFTGYGIDIDTTGNQWPENPAEAMNLFLDLYNSYIESGRRVLSESQAGKFEARMNEHIESRKIQYSLPANDDDGS